MGCTGPRWASSTGPTSADQLEPAREDGLISLLIDCDPGIDDAVALMLAAAASDSLRLLGVTTVFGNVPVEQTAVNAQKILQLCGVQSIPVAKGCPRSLLRPAISAQFIHGASGLGRLSLPAPAAALDQRHAVDFLLDKINEADEKVTLVALGPLTNVALAIVKDPATMAKLKQIVIVGGTLRELGNMHNTAGFNGYADPHAAEIVLRSGIDLVQCLTDATHLVRTKHSNIARIRKIGTRSADAVAEMFGDHSVEDQPSNSEADDPVGGCMHDPCCIAYLLAPQIFHGRNVNVQVETASDVSMGRFVIDWWGRSTRTPNAYVLNKVDRNEFFDLLGSYLARLPN
jgi:purine nucleosidase